MQIGKAEFHPYSDKLPDFSLLEEAVLTLAKQVKALEKEVYNLKYKGQCE